VTPLWPHGDPREAARRILEERKFRELADRATPPSWWDRFWQGVWDAFRHLFHGPTDLRGASGFVEFIGYLIIAAVAIGVIFVLVRFGPGLFSGRARRARAARESFALEAVGTAAELRARAAAAEASGNHREAATLLWGSLLYALDERGRARYDSARTPGEWRRIVRDRTFDGVARDATVALFADDPVDAELVARMNERYDRLVAP
jgi:hypothetical protein